MQRSKRRRIDTRSVIILKIDTRSVIILKIDTRSVISTSFNIIYAQVGELDTRISKEVESSFFFFH
jgi:hypothetical protein